eukprot:gb/GFBE01081016.1/.p1 GENE.gb/GFBE01081016.1/~~gb/GFBE01081016.1/.p1  ORF type:complete len:518 (+),score=65.35 gb/GFBE01081016.1/:1-1554(+)
MTSDSDEDPMPHCFRNSPIGAGGYLGPVTADRPCWRILAFGDSLTAGFCRDGDHFSPYGKALAESIPSDVSAEVWVCGLSGAEALDMVERLDSRRIGDVADRTGAGLRRIVRERGKFDLVLIMAGTNDLEPGAKAGPIATTVMALHTACHVERVRTVLLSVPPNRSVTKSKRYESLWIGVNSRLQAWANSRGRVEGVLSYVDVGQIVPYSKDQGDPATAFWEDDGLHLSPAGSEHLGRSLAPMLWTLRNTVNPPLPRRPYARGGPMPQRICLEDAARRQHPACATPARTAEEQPSQLRLLFYGDSLTAGFHATGRLFAPYAESFSCSLLSEFQVESWICGLSGLRAVDLHTKRGAESIEDAVLRTGPGLQRLLQRDTSKFDVAFIMLGTNDLGKESLEPGQIFRSIQALHSECHRMGMATVALAVPESRAVFKFDDIEERQKEVNQLLHQWATSEEEKCRTLFVDTCQLIPFEPESELWEMDGLHFSAEGSRVLGLRLAATVKPFLQRIGQRRATGR